MQERKKLKSRSHGNFFERCKRTYILINAFTSGQKNAKNYSLQAREILKVLNR